jgi:predicted Zn-dependent protease
LTALLYFTKTKRWNYILFGFGWFFAFLLPSFIRPNSTLVADFIEHRLYVPIIGLFIVLLETDLIKKIDMKKKSVFFITGSIIIALSVITIVHSRSFVDRLAFWENAAKNSPHYPLAHRNLGAMDYLDGKLDSAEKEFKTALELNPEEQMAHNNLGLIYFDEGKYKESEDEYKKELENNPYYDNAYFNLGLLYWKQNRIEEAVTSWKKAVEINPGNTDAMQTLMIYYYNIKDYTNAIPYINQLYKMGIPLSPQLLQLLKLSTI